MAIKQTVKVGMIGFGIVGTGVARILYSASKPHLRGRSFNLELVKIVDLDITRDRGVTIPSGVLSTNVNDILENPDIHIVIELIGGYEPAKTFTLRAFEKGKSVVSANKALIAKHGNELFDSAARANVSYMFEASVGSGIPIIRCILNGLNANTIESIYGILNGTTNYILTGMAREGLDYRKALTRAQSLGYAEADPTADISGSDALNKIVILARLAFGVDLHIEDIYCEGIEQITIQDIKHAGELGYTIKLLAIAQRHEDGSFEVRVHPTLVPSDSVLASVDDEFNAVEIYGDAVGRELFYGKGAGMMPTASAVVSDTVDIASRIRKGTPTNVARIILTEAGPQLMNFGNLILKYYLRFTVDDRPGVVAAISNVFAEENISIESIIQRRVKGQQFIPLVIMTHEAREGDIQRAMKKFKSLDAIKGRVQLIRVEEV
jgi:homoserine dehydrogenase